jgi:hypothetical protein
MHNFDPSKTETRLPTIWQSGKNLIHYNQASLPATSALALSVGWVCHHPASAFPLLALKRIIQQIPFRRRKKASQKSMKPVCDVLARRGFPQVHGAVHRADAFVRGPGERSGAPGVPPVVGGGRGYPPAGHCLGNNREVTSCSRFALCATA